LHSQKEAKILENERCKENVNYQLNEHGTFQNSRNVYSHRSNAENYQNNFQNYAPQNSNRNFRNERVDDRPRQPYQQRHIPQQSSRIMINVSRIKMEEEEMSRVTWVGEEKILEIKSERISEMISVVVMETEGEKVVQDGLIEII
jgi:hypothetical protein